MKFLRIITATITAKSKLKLPKKFVERYEAEVPGSVTLKVPTGARWRVKVDKNKDEIWLGNGLYKFAESLDIKYGHCLVFDYDVKHAMFHMAVIDTSATEIEYPIILNCTDDKEEADQGGSSDAKHPKVNKENEDEDDDVVVIVNKNDDANMGSKRCVQALSPFYGSARKKTRAASSRNDRVEKINGINRSTEYEAGKVKTYYTNVKKGYFGTETILSSEGRIHCVIQARLANQDSARTEKSIRRAKELIAEEPVCIIAMSHSYVWRRKPNVGSRSCQLPFPMPYAVEYFNLKIEDVELRIGYMTWTVKYLFRSDRRRSAFSNGWKQFAIDNDLEMGDVCMFELIKGAANALNVVIFRVMDEDESPKS